MDFIDPKCFLFVPVFNWLLQRPEISDGARLTYSILCRYATRADGQGIKFADCSQRTIAKDLSRSVRSIKDYISELSEQHLVVIIQCRATGNRGSENHYYFPRHPWMSHFRRADYLFSNVLGGTNDARLGAESCTTQGQNPAPPESSEKRRSAAEIPTNTGLFRPPPLGAESCTPLGEKKNKAAAEGAMRADGDENPEKPDAAAAEWSDEERIKMFEVPRELELCGIGRKARSRLLPDLRRRNLTPLQIRLAFIEAKKSAKQNATGLLIRKLEEDQLPPVKLTPELVVKLVNSGDVVQIGSRRVSAGWCRWNTTAIHIFAADVSRMNVLPRPVEILAVAIVPETILTLSGHEPGKE